MLAADIVDEQLDIRPSRRITLVVLGGNAAA